MDFQQAMRHYRILRRAYERSQITADAFEKRINSMVVLDKGGHRWMIGVNSGQWYRYDGQKWIKDTPPTYPSLPTPDIVKPDDAKTEFKEELSVSKPQVKQRKAMRNSWIWVTIAFLLLAFFAVVILGLMTDLSKIPSQILALVQQPTPTLTIAPTIPPTTTATQTEPPPTPTITPPPYDLGKTILGHWTTTTSNADYRFYPDNTFVFYALDRNELRAGRYSIGENNVTLESVTGEQTTGMIMFSLVFENEDQMMLTNEAGISEVWTRDDIVPWNSRHEDPIAVLFELSNRLGWSTPEPDCAFDPTDEESEYQYNCLVFENGISLTWVVQAPSTGTDRAMERNLITVKIIHQSDKTFQDEMDDLRTNLEPSDPFYGYEAYSSSSDLGWFSMNEFAWVDGTWIYRVLRVNAFQSPHQAPGLALTIETLFEVLEGKPPHSSSETIPTEEPEGVYRYSEQILGTWKQRHQSEEVLTFEEPNGIKVSSEPGDYNYSGIYYFSDDSNVVFELDIGVVFAEISIDDNIMTLTINGIASIYDRIE